MKTKRKHNSKSNKKKINKWYWPTLIFAVLALTAIAIISLKNNSGIEPLNESSSNSFSDVSAVSSSNVKSSASSSGSQTQKSKKVIIPQAENITEKIKKSKDVAKVLHEDAKNTKQTEENTVVVTDIGLDVSGLEKRYVKLPVKYLPQNPELPTGCEITSLTTVLNYYGFNVSKTTLASSKYLKQSSGRANFWEVFVGSPASIYGCGCYAKPIVEAANKYLQEKNSTYRAFDYSGNEFEELLKTVEEGIPVIIWGTENMKPAYVSKVWDIDGKKLELLVPEHCLVLIGFDLDAGKAIFSDPLRGIVSYDLKTAKERYMSLHFQAVVVEDTKPKEIESQESTIEESEAQGSEISVSCETTSDISSSEETENNGSDESYELF